MKQSLTDREIHDKVLKIVNDSKSHGIFYTTDTEDPLHASLSSFSGNLRDFNLSDDMSIADIFDLVDPHADLVEGIGFAQLREDFETCILDNRRPYETFILPLIIGGLKLSLLVEVMHDGSTGLIVYVVSRLNGKGGMEYLQEAITSAFKDDLTGLFNLNTCYTHLKDCVRNIYFVLFDLNKFKSLNDTYGHAFGDVILRDIGTYLIGISTNNEICYRRSGDEFMINVQFYDKDYALKLIDKIGDYLENLIPAKYPTIGKVQISAAFGIVDCPFGNSAEFSFREHFIDIIKVADLAMYQAKHAGKRVVMLHPDDFLPILKEGKLDTEIDELAKQIGR